MGWRRFGRWLAGVPVGVASLVGVVVLGCGVGSAGAQPRSSPAPAAHVYFAYEASNSGWIVEAALNGAHAKTIAKDQRNPTGIALGSRHLYWADAGSKTIVEASLSGRNARTIVKHQSGLGGIAVGRDLYWISGDTIVEANLNGTNVKTIVTGQNGPVAVTVGGGHLYWAISGGYSDNDGAIVEANLDGTGVHTIAQAQPTPSGVAVAGSHLYWSNGASDTVVEANLDGTEAKTIVTETYVQLLGDLAAGAGHLYWGFYDTSDPYWTLATAHLDGTHARAIAANKALPQAVAVGP